MCEGLSWLLIDVVQGSWSWTAKKAKEGQGSKQHPPWFPLDAFGCDENSLKQSPRWGCPSWLLCANWSTASQARCQTSQPPNTPPFPHLKVRCSLLWGELEGRGSQHHPLSFVWESESLLKDGPRKWETFLMTFELWEWLTCPTPSPPSGKYFF